MRMRMSLEILKNFWRLLGYDFWKQAFTNPNFPTWCFIQLILGDAVMQIFKMLTEQNYGMKKE